MTINPRDETEAKRRLDTLQSAAYAAVLAGATADELSDFYLAGVEEGMRALHVRDQGVALLAQYRERRTG